MPQITSRDRVIAALNHKEPDRVPIDVGGFVSGICYIAYDNLKKKLGIISETEIDNPVTGTVIVEEEVLKRFRIDTRHIKSNPGSDYDPQWRDDESFVDEFGVRWRKPVSSYYYDMIEHPMKDGTIAALKNYKLPEPSDSARVEGLYEKAKKYHEQGFAVFSAVPGLFELATYIRGMADLFTDSYDNRDFLEAFLDKLLENLIQTNDYFLEKTSPYVDGITIWGDLSDQRGPYLKPEMWRQIYKPREAELIKGLKKHLDKIGGKVVLHTCGSPWLLMDDIIEMGVDVLNPVQTTAENMDPFILKERFGEIISFWGGVSGQTVMPFGTTADVVAESKRIISALGPGGGYIFGNCHNIQNDVPADNLISLFDSGYEFGKYGL